MSEVSEYGIRKGGERVSLPVEEVVALYGRLGLGSDWRPQDEAAGGGFVADTPDGRIDLALAEWEFGGYRLRVWTGNDWVRALQLELNGYGSLDLPFCEAVGIPDAPEVLSLAGYDPEDFTSAYEAARR